MAGTLYTATGTKIFIGPAQTSEPANAAAYAALVWTEIGMAESIGQYGDTANVVTGATLVAGRAEKAKGIRNAGDPPLVVFPDSEDAGQQALIAAEATNLRYPFKVEHPNKLNATGTNGIDYFMALVASKFTNERSNDAIARQTFNLPVTSKITSVAPTAGS